jgi:hypothetical protein
MVTEPLARSHSNVTGPRLIPAHATSGGISYVWRFTVGTGVGNTVPQAANATPARPVADLRSIKVRSPLSNRAAVASQTRSIQSFRSRSRYSSLRTSPRTQVSSTHHSPTSEGTWGLRRRLGFGLIRQHPRHRAAMIGFRCRASVSTTQEAHARRIGSRQPRVGTSRWQRVLCVEAACSYSVVRSWIIPHFVQVMSPHRPGSFGATAIPSSPCRIQRMAPSMSSPAIRNITSTIATAAAE